MLVTKMKGAKFVFDPDRLTRCTHLILGDHDSACAASSSSALAGKRTVRVLAAVARGAWVLQPTWVYQCMEEEKWVDEKGHAIGGYGAAAAADDARLRKVSLALNPPQVQGEPRPHSEEMVGGDGEGGESLGVCSGQTICVQHFALSADLNNK